ncbi:MAG: hypothetical protein IJK20_00950 [Bacteroidales bacterium]|jgi:hypothetical protein|nr:hypothetical protein [Bacteroidales bacterium]
MKKNLSLLCIAMAAIACGNDGPEGTVTGDIDYIEIQQLAGSGADAFVHHNYVLNLSNDASGRINGITETHYIIFDPGAKPELHSTESLTITYNGTSGTIARHCDGTDYEDSFVLDDAGNLKEFSQEKSYKSTYKYDNGYLVKIQGYDNYSGMDISWSGGDLVKAGDTELTYSSDPNPFADTFDLTVRPLNEWYPSPLYFYAAGFFGKHSAHLVKTIGEGDYAVTYNYFKDSKGRIEKITVSSTYEGVTSIEEQYLIHYK